MEGGESDSPRSEACHVEDGGIGGRVRWCTHLQRNDTNTQRGTALQHES
jgi:hypothetical protein